MHDHSTPVPWAVWLEHRPGDVRRPDRMIVRLGQGWRCLLCEWSVAATERAEHHLQHMLQLEEWETTRAETKTGPKPDSRRRTEDRRARRRQALEQAEAFGRDPFLYAVDRVERVTSKPDDKRVRPIVRRRLRRPKTETWAAVKRLHGQGLVPSAIANQLDLSPNYTMRLIRLIEAGQVPK